MIENQLQTRQPAIPSMPDSLTQATTPIFNLTSESWIPPRAASYMLVAQAKDWVKAYETARPPAPIAQLRERVASFVCHFFITLSDERLNKIVAADWLDTLKDFPFPVLCAAISEWRNDMNKKPTPADIRKLCIYHYPKKEWDRLQRAKTIANMTPSEKTVLAGPVKEEWRPPTAEEKERVRKLMASIGITPKEEKHEQKTT